MEKLEEMRLQMLGRASSDKEHGLIIPIILRGGKYLPSFIRNERKCYDFESYTLPRCKSENIFCTHIKYASEIRKIAADVCDRYLELKEVCNLPKECKDFRIPAEEEIYPWLEGISDIKDPFPCHRRNQ